MLGATSLTISSITVLEIRIALQSRHGDDAVGEFDEMLKDVRYGNGRYGLSSISAIWEGMGHPAQLTIIDCAAYGLAKVRGEPLLFKGGDFNRTDLQPAL